ncbi:MAG: exodeoxyribonuclease III [Oscillospiraceae bacterium]|nr:exodeoxyribonuclease III [Oscillospiraceae bacterium]
MRLISWNVNGLRACFKKGFFDFFKEIDGDIFCVQETKMQENQMQISADGYFQFWNSSDKKGYSGTLIFSKKEPISVIYNFGSETKKHPNEGRIITLEYRDFFLVNVYSPNSKRELSRLDYRMEWEDDFREYLLTLDDKKGVILCGDFNVAHEEIDLKNPKTNRLNAGFTDQERQKFSELINHGFVDTFRLKYPGKENCYTWWSYMHQSRKRNVGWRIDYFLTLRVSNEEILDSSIHDEILGSDHCPIKLEMRGQLC